MESKQITPIKDIKDRYFKFSNEKNEKKYNWEIKLINDSLDINITGTTNLVNSQYQKTYSKNELENISRFFKFFDDMDSIFSQIEIILKNGKYEFYENDKSIKISLKTEIYNMDKIELDIPIKEKKGENIQIKVLYKIIKEIKEKVNILENENQEIKKENEEIKKENEEIKKIIQFNKEQYEKELNTKIDKTLKDFQNIIENKINNIDLEKNQLMKTQINTLIQNYSNNLKQRKDDNNNSKIEIMNEKIEKELSINTCKFIKFDKIKIKNIGKENIKNLYFVKDEKQSSNDIIFITNDRNDNINKLSLDGKLVPSTESTQSFDLKINSPKNNKKYILIIYVREKENGPNISNPLKIVINVKESDEERINREKEEEKKRKEENEKPKNIDYKGLNKDDVEKLYHELDGEYKLRDIMNKEEAINKIIELKCDKEELTEWIFEKL